MTYRTAFKIIGIASLATLAILAYAFSTYDPDSPSSIEFRKRRAIEAKADSIANATKEKELEKQRIAKEKERENSVSPKERRKKLIKKQFSRWDGSHRTLAERIKSTMNDPDSFEHVETLYWDTEGNTIVVQTTFRGKNIYGGVVTNTVKVKVNINDSKIVEVL